MKKNIMMLMLMVIMGTGFSASAQEMVVIVNNANPVSSMKRIEVKLYYMRKIKKSWPELGESIQPVGLAIDNSAKEEFLSTIMKMSQKQLDAYFKQVQFSSGDPVPPMFESESAIIDYVSANKGALAYISNSSFLSSGGKVKKVNIQ